MNQLKVCIGTSCHLNGANSVSMTFRHLMEEYNLYEKLELSAIFCANGCSEEGVAVHFNDNTYRITPDEARQFFAQTVLPGLK